MKISRILSLTLTSGALLMISACGSDGDDEAPAADSGTSADSGSQADSGASADSGSQADSGSPAKTTRTMEKDDACIRSSGGVTDVYIIAKEHGYECAALKLSNSGAVAGLNVNVTGMPGLGFAGFDSSQDGADGSCALGDTSVYSSFNTDSWDSTGTISGAPTAATVDVQLEDDANILNYDFSGVDISKSCDNKNNYNYVFAEACNEVSGGITRVYISTHAPNDVEDCSVFRFSTASTTAGMVSTVSGLETLGFAGHAGKYVNGSCPATHSGYSYSTDDRSVIGSISGSLSALNVTLRMERSNHVRTFSATNIDASATCP